MTYPLRWPRGLAAALLLAATATGWAKKLDWRAVSPQELAKDAPRLEADAPAEILYWRVDTDDRDFPDRRYKTEYVRLKIYDPEKAAAYTRISRLYYSTGSYRDDHIEIHARLTLPNGTVRDFGEHAVRERNVTREGAVDSWTRRVFGRSNNGLKEKFLAVTGVVRGAIIDYQVTEAESAPERLDITYVQRQHVPIHHFEWQLRVGHNSEYGYDQYAFNDPQAKFTHAEGGKVVAITADRLPSLPDEPFSGARLDTSFAVVNSCVPLHLTFETDNEEDWQDTFSQKAGPWAPYASIMAAVVKSLAAPTRRITELARQLVAGASSDLEKATRLHAFTQERYQRYLQLPKPDDADSPHRAALEDLLDDKALQQVRADASTFDCLEIALARAAGLDPKLLLLPSRKLKMFDPSVVCTQFLDDDAIGYQIGKQWHVSSPTGRIRRPFDQLPWQDTGVPALVAERNKQWFIQPPVAGADASWTRNFAILTLSAAGDLAGQCRTYYSGHSGAAIRRQLRGKTDAERRTLLEKKYRDELQADHVTIMSIKDVDSADAPLEINYAVKLPGFAVAANDRLIFKPSLFHWHREPYFTAEKRLHMVMFPYPRRTTDHVLIQLPPGYVPETKESPPSYRGQALNYVAGITYEPGANQMQLTRDWAVNSMFIPLKYYQVLHAWSAAVATSDRMDMVLVRKGQGHAGLAATAAAKH